MSSTSIFLPSSLPPPQPPSLFRNFVFSKNSVNSSPIIDALTAPPSPATAMAAVAVNSLQLTPAPLTLRTSRTDPSLTATARRYASENNKSNNDAIELYNNSNNLGHNICRRVSSPPSNISPRIRQRPQPTPEHSLLVKRHRPEPQLTKLQKQELQSQSPRTTRHRRHHHHHHHSPTAGLISTPNRTSSAAANISTSMTSSAAVDDAPVRHSNTPVNKKRLPSSQRHERAASLGSAAARARCGGHFSISDFTLGKVLGAGGTATVIRAELVRSRLASQRIIHQQYLKHHEYRSAQKQKSHHRRKSERTGTGSMDSMEYGASLSLGAETFVAGTASSALETNEFALKIVQKKALSKRALHYLTREIMIHRAIQSHVNVVSLYDVFEDSASIYLVQELLGGGDLYSALKRERGGIPEATALDIVEQILQAIAFMHKHGFAHRDVKPENIMFAERPSLREGRVGIVKLIDFGLACARDPKAPMRERTSGEKCGTIRYAAPEVITDASYIPELADVWSVGVVLYSAIAHRNPYCGKTEKEVLARIEGGGPCFKGSEWDEVSVESKELIEGMLSRKPMDRPSALQALLRVRGIKEGMTRQGEGQGDGEGGDGSSERVECSGNSECGGDAGEGRQHSRNIFDGLMALFGGNCKE